MSRLVRRYKVVSDVRPAKAAGAMYVIVQLCRSREARAVRPEKTPAGMNVRVFEYIDRVVRAAKHESINEYRASASHLLAWRRLQLRGR